MATSLTGGVRTDSAFGPVQQGLKEEIQKKKKVLPSASPKGQRHVVDRWRAEGGMEEEDDIIRGGRSIFVVHLAQREGTGECKANQVKRKKRRRPQ